MISNQLKYSSASLFQLVLWNIDQKNADARDFIAFERYSTLIPSCLYTALLPSGANFADSCISLTKAAIAKPSYPLTSSLKRPLQARLVRSPFRMSNHAITRRPYCKPEYVNRYRLLYSHYTLRIPTVNKFLVLRCLSRIASAFVQTR
jgi:hypothetical protein